MKKRLRVIVVLGCLFAASLLIFNMYNDNDKTRLNYLSQKTGMDLTKGKLVTFKQDGFVDIETTAKVEYPLYEINEMLKNEEWQEYPLDLDLSLDLSRMLDKEVFDEISANCQVYKIIENDVSIMKLLAYDMNKEILYYYCVV